MMVMTMMEIQRRRRKTSGGEREAGGVLARAVPASLSCWPLDRKSPCCIHQQLVIPCRI